MENNFSIDNEKLIELIGKLSDGEFKMLLFVQAYLLKTGKKVFAINEESRSFASSIGFVRTSVGYGNLLSSLAEKQLLVRELRGIYSVPENLFLPDQDCQK